MSKILMILPLIILTFLILFSSKALAASLTVTKIGALDLGGQMYNDWWYSGSSPTLYGTAEANAEVTVTIGETSGTATADGSGNWSYPTTTLSSGDHSITVTSGAETVSFTLHAGQTYQAGTTTSTTNTEVTGETTKGGIPIVPETGPRENIILAFIAGAAMIWLGYKGLHSIERTSVRTIYR